jgi:hypothetical protein
MRLHRFIVPPARLLGDHHWLADPQETFLFCLDCNRRLLIFLA